MRFSERFANQILNSISTFEGRYVFLHKNLSKMLSMLLLGFLVGNMFVSILNTTQDYLVWCLPSTWTQGKGIHIDKCVGVWILVFLEFTSYLAYPVANRNPALFPSVFSSKVHRLFWRFVNMFKIGLMLGFFVDAFKVGS